MTQRNSVVDDIHKAVDELFWDAMNPDAVSHIINPPMNLHIWEPGMSGKDVAEIATLTGQELTSLCGHKWIPTKKPSPDRICKVCLKIATEMIREDLTSGE